MTNQLTNEQLAQIAERAEWAKGDILADSSVMTARDKLACEDVPRLLAEIERLKKELNGDGVLTLTEQLVHAREEIQRLDGDVTYYKGYADRFSEIISEQGKKIEDLKAELAKYRKFVQCVEHSEINVDEGTIFIKLRGDYEDLISEFIGVGGETACLKD